MQIMRTDSSALFHVGKTLLAVPCLVVWDNLEKDDPALGKELD